MAPSAIESYIAVTPAPDQEPDTYVNQEYVAHLGDLGRSEP